MTDQAATPAPRSRLQRADAIVATACAVYFAASMSLVAFQPLVAATSTEVAVWFTLIGAGILGFGIAAGVALRSRTVWAATTLVTVSALIGMYVPFAASNACAAVGDPGGCASSGVAAAIAGCIPLFLAVLIPVSLSRWITTRRATV